MTVQGHDLILGTPGFGQDRADGLADAVGRQLIRQFGFAAPCTEAVAETVLRERLAIVGDKEGLVPRGRGGEGSFNGVKIKLEKDDLLKLISDTLANRLVPVEGFFFGQQEIWPEDLGSVFLFVGKANLAIQQGKDVYYDSWW